MSREYNEDSANVHGGGSRFGAVVVLLIGLLGIAYAAVLVASRAEGFRAYVQDRLGQAVGWPVLIERAYVSLALNVICEGVAVEGGLVAGRPGFQVERLTLKVSPWNLWRGMDDAIQGLDMEDVYVAVARDEQGAWQPAAPAAALRRIAGWLGSDLPAVSAEEFVDKAWAVLFSKPLRLSRARATWYGERDVLFEMTGADWRNEIVRVAGCEFMYRILTVAEAGMSGRERLKGVRLEFLQTPEKTIVLRAEFAGRRASDAVATTAARITGRAFPPHAPPDEKAELRSALFGTARP